MTFAHFFSHYLKNGSFLVISELDIVESVSAIFLQLINLSLSLAHFLESPNVYISIIFPPLSKSIPSLLFVYLSWILLLPWNISPCLQWVYIVCFSLSIKESVVTAICGSPIFHLAECHSSAISRETSKRCVVKFPMNEHSYSEECVVCHIRIFVLNGSESMRHSLPQSTDWKSDFNLNHFLNRFVS